MAPPDKMRQSHLDWPLGSRVGWRESMWAGRPGGGSRPPGQPCPALGSWETPVEEAAPFASACLLIWTVGVIMVLASQSSPGRTEHPVRHRGPALGLQLHGCERRDHRGGISQGTDIILCHLPGTALPGDGRVHAHRGLYLKVT